MKQISKNKPKKNTEKKILKEKLSESTIDLIVEMKVRALINLFIRARLLQTALKEYVTGIIMPGELPYILYTDDKLLKDFSFSRDRNRKILDIKTVNGQKKLMTIFEGVRLIKVNIFEKECFDPLLTAILYLGAYIYKNMTPEYFLLFTKIENDVRETTCEAIGYWTAKLEHKKRSKNQETKKQQRKIKEDCVYESWVKMINNSAEKKVLEDLSQNKIAKRIYDDVFPLLKDKKTETRKFVLTRTKKTDKEGSLILSGLDIDTIIDIMSKTDKFRFNPFKK